MSPLPSAIVKVVVDATDVWPAFVQAHSAAAMKATTAKRLQLMLRSFSGRFGH
jgi:hypothetical protein